MRQINTRFFLILSASLTVATGGLFALHRLQAGNIAQALLWQASQAEQARKTDDAARYLGRYLEFAPDDLEQRSRLGSLLADPKVATTPRRVGKARFVIEQVLAKDPQRHALRQDLVRLALSTRQLDFAREHLDFLKQAQPQSADVLFLEGEWLELQPRTRDTFLRAEGAYKHVITVCPTKAEAYLRLALLYQQDDFGRALTQRRHTEDIQNLVAAALKKLPEDPGILSLAAEVAQDRGDAAAARAHLEEGLKQNPAEPRLYQALARVQNRAGKRSEAIASLRRGLQQVPREDRYGLAWTLANLLLDDSEADGAQAVIADIRAQNARSAEYLEARLQMLQGRWFEAAKTFEKLRPILQELKELALQLDLYLGTCYEHLEEPTLQLAACRRAAKADPTSLAARRGLATAYWSLGQVTEALEEYEQIVRGNSNRSEAARWQLEYARLLLQSRPKELARVELEVTEAEKELPGSVDAALLRAELALRQGRREQRGQVETILRDVQRASPDRHEPWVFLAGLAQADGKGDEAKRLLQGAEAKLKDSVDFRIARARFWGSLRTEESETALRRLEVGLDEFTLPQQDRLLQALADAHGAQDRPADAARLLRKAAAMPQRAKDLRLRVQLLELAMQQDDDDGMHAVIEEMKEIEAGGPSIYGGYGEAVRLIAQARKGRLDGLETARRLLTAAAAQRPNWHAVTLARAEIDAMQDRTEQAIAHYRLALDQGSRDPRVMKQLVLLLSQAQRYEEAEAAVRQLHEQVDAPGGLHRASIALAYNRKDYDRALNLLRQSLQANAQHFRDHLWLGQVLMARGQASAEAETAFRRAVALGGNQPETWVGLVRYLAGTGQADKARLELKKAEQQLGADTRPLALAQCCEILGDPEEALKHYQLALQQQPNAAPVARAAADFYLRTGRLRDAAPLYRRLLDRALPVSEQDVTRARRGLALTLAQSGKPEQVTQALQLVGLSLDDKGNLVESNGADQAEEQLAQARVLAHMASHRLRSRAITLLEGLDQKRTLQVEEQFVLARLLHQHAGDAVTWRKTRDLLKEITEREPRSSRYLAFAAHLLLLNKEAPLAEPLVERLEKLEKDRHVPAGGYGSIELRARCLELRGQGAQALALLQQYAGAKDAPPERVLLLATLHGRLEQFAEAMALCQQVVERGKREERKNLVDEAMGSAVAILRAGKPPQAQAARHGRWQEQADWAEARLRAMISDGPGHVNAARIQLADLMEVQGRVDEVEKLCRRVLADEPHNLVALNNLAWHLGQSARRGDEGLDLIARAIAKHGPRPELLDTRAVVYLSLGKCEESLQDLQRAVNEAPTPARYFHLSRAHHQAKDQSSAVAALQRANDLGLSSSQLHPSEHDVYREVVAELRK